MKFSHSWKSIAAGLALASAAHVAQAGVPVGSRSAAAIATDNARIAAILAEEQRTDTIKKMVIVGGVGGAIGFLGLKWLGLTPIKRRREGERGKEQEQEIRKWIDSIPEMKRIFVEVERIVGEQSPGAKASLEHHTRESGIEWIKYSFRLNKTQVTITLTPPEDLVLDGFNYETGEYDSEDKVSGSMINIDVLETALVAIKNNTPLPKNPIQGHMGSPMTQSDHTPIPTHIAPVVHTTTEEDPFLLSQKVWEDIGRFEIGSFHAIREAEVYIKYSRFEQAKTILKEGLDLEGDFTRRMHICWMLSCIYYKLGNVLELDRYANIVIDSSIHTPEMAERVRSVCNMGKRIDPEHPLYTVPDWAKDEGEKDTMEMTGRIANDRIAERNIDPHFQGGTAGEQPISTTERTPWSFPAESSLWTRNGDGDLSLDIDFVPPNTRHQPAGMDEASRVGLDYGTLMRKIELAEEFLRIGDTEGAKDLIEEVIEEGRFSVPRGSLVSDSITIIRSMIPDEYKNSPQGTVGDMPEFSPPSSEVEEDLENMSNEELIRKLESCKEISRILAGNIVSEIGTVMGKRGYNLDFTNKDPSSIACIDALIDMLSGKNSPGESAQGGEGEREGNSDDLSQQGSDLEGENYPAESSQNAFLSKFDEIIEKYQRELERLGRNKRTVINQINSGVYELSEEFDDGVTREKKGYEEKISRIQKLKESFMAFLEKGDGKISDTRYDIRIEGKVIFSIIKLSADEVRVFRHLPDGNTKSRTLGGNWLIQIWTSGILDLENI